MKPFYILSVNLILLPALVLANAPSPVVSANNRSGSIVSANESLMKQLKIVSLEQAEMHDSLRVPARVELDQQRVARIGATVTGRITETKAFLGQDVRKGEPLAILNSAELGMAQSAYLKASSQVNLHRLAVNRARRLLESDVIAAAQLQERESELIEAEVDLRAAADQLRVMGMNEKDFARFAHRRAIYSFTPIAASLSGTVIERNVTVGQVVQPSDALFTIADLSHVWLVAELPEQLAHWAHEGDEASADIAALPDEVIKGKLIYVADIVNSKTRTVTVRMDVANPRYIIKPQMLATLMIRKQGMRELVLPDSAVVRDKNRDHVFVEIRPGEFELRPVQLGIRDGQFKRVVEGLKTGERVVVDGVFHLNNQRLRKELE
jgi:cobalt-zinc-cadmium efflux system membrane fusion protein